MLRPRGFRLSWAIVAQLWGIGETGRAWRPADRPRPRAGQPHALVVAASLHQPATGRHRSSTGQASGIEPIPPQYPLC